MSAKTFGELSLDMSLPTPRDYRRRDATDNDVAALTRRFHALQSGGRLAASPSRKATQTRVKSAHSASTFPESQLPLSSPLSQMSILRDHTTRADTPPQNDSDDMSRSRRYEHHHHHHHDADSEPSITDASPSRRRQKSKAPKPQGQDKRDQISAQSFGQAAGTITPPSDAIPKKRSHASGLSMDSERRNELRAMDAKLQLQQTLIRAIENVMKLGNSVPIYKGQCTPLVQVMTELFNTIRESYDVEQNNDLHRNMIRMSRRLRAWTSTVRRSKDAYDWPLVAVTLEAYTSKFSAFISALPLADDYNLTVTLNSKIEAHNESRRKDAEMRALQKEAAEKRKQERAEIRRLREDIKHLRRAVGDGLEPPSVKSSSEQHATTEGSIRNLTTSMVDVPAGLDESLLRGSLNIYEPTPTQTRTFSPETESDDPTSSDSDAHVEERPASQPRQASSSGSTIPPPVPPKSPDMMIPGQARAHRPEVPPLEIPATPKNRSASPRKPSSGLKPQPSVGKATSIGRTMATTPITRSPSRPYQTSTEMDISTLPRSIATSPVTVKPAVTPQPQTAIVTETSIPEKEMSRAKSRASAVSHTSRKSKVKEPSAVFSESKTASPPPAFHFETTTFAPQAKRPAHHLLDRSVSSPKSAKRSEMGDHQQRLDSTKGPLPEMAPAAFIIPPDFTMGHSHSLSMPTTLVDGPPVSGAVQLTHSFARFNFPAKGATDAGGSITYSPLFPNQMPSPEPFVTMSGGGASSSHRQSHHSPHDPPPVPSLAHSIANDDNRSEDLITFDDQTVLSRTHTLDKTQSMPRTPSTVRPGLPQPAVRKAREVAEGSKAGWTDMESLRTVTPVQKKRFTAPPEYGVLGSPFSQSKFLWDTKDEFGDFSTDITSERG